MKLTKFHQAIFKTLVYSDLFNCPLSARELHRYLYKFSTTNKFLESQLTNLSFVQRRGKYYALAGRDSVFKNHAGKLKETQRKIEIAEKIVKLLTVIPTIKMIGLSGSVAARNATKNADIDLFFITSQNSLWITRLITVSVLSLLRIKRKPGVYLAPDMICTNMWMSESHLETNRKNLFIAREIAQMKILFDRSNTYARFMHANDWVYKYFPNLPKLPQTQIQNHSSSLNIIMCGVNYLTFRLQKFYMRSKITCEKMTLHYAAFHPKDISGIVMQTYTQRLKNFSRAEDKSRSVIPDIRYITPGS